MFFKYGKKNKYFKNIIILISKINKYDILNWKLSSGFTKLIVNQNVRDDLCVNTCRDNSYVENVILNNINEIKTY